MIRRVPFVAAVVLLLGVAFASVAADPANPQEPSAQAKESEQKTKVTLSESDAKVKDILDSLSTQSKEKLVVESTVKGTIPTIELKDVPLETALSTVCKLAKIEWRKVYIAPDAKLLEQPDKFAATVRLMCGMSFPDIVTAGSSTSKLGAYFADKKAVAGAEDSACKTLGMARVYLITNDSAVAAKALEDEKSKGSEAIEKMGKLAKEQIDTFLKMSPEDREQALVAGLSLMDQVGPEYMNAVMQSMMNIDPEYMRHIMQRQFDTLFAMTPEQRRSMMKMQMESVKFITPEQQQMLQEDALAVAKEMQENAGTVTGN